MSRFPSIFTKTKPSQKGEIATILTLLGLGIVAAGIIVGNQLVQQGTRYLPKASEPTSGLCSSGWQWPVSASSALPPGCDIKAQSSYVIGDTLTLGLWCGTTGYTKTVPIEGGVPNWNSPNATGWQWPISAADALKNTNSGEIQSQNAYVIGDKLTFGLWRGNVGYTLVVPIEGGVPNWNSPAATGWQWPVSASSALPPGCDIKAQSSYVIGDTLTLGLWCGTTGYTKTVPIEGGVPNWNSPNATGWQWPISAADALKNTNSGEIQSQNAYVIGDKLTFGLWRGNVGYTQIVPIVGGNPVWFCPSATSILSPTISSSPTPQGYCTYTIDCQAPSNNCSYLSGCYSRTCTYANKTNSIGCTMSNNNQGWCQEGNCVPIPTNTPIPTNPPGYCNYTTDCAPPSNNCSYLSGCYSRTCTYVPKSNGTFCTQSNNNSGICENGNCVPIPTNTPVPTNPPGYCNSAADCTPASNTCTYLSGCFAHSCTYSYRTNNTACVLDYFGTGICQNGECIQPPIPTPSITRTPTQGPTIPPQTITTVPTQGSCSRKSEGDANCDGRISGVDFSIWLNTQCHPTGNQTCADKRADFTGDGAVDDTDYQIWFSRRGT